MESFQTQTDRALLPRNMIENSMFEEEPDVVDLAKEPPLYQLDPDDAVYEPRSSRLLVRGLGENELEEEEEDYESSARLLGMSFMNRSSSLRTNASLYNREDPSGTCTMPSLRTVVLGAFVVVVVACVAMVIYFLPKCTFTKEGCHKANHSMELIYPISSDGQLFPWTEIKLPKNVKPIHYDLSLHPNLTTNQFEGNVSILVKVLEDTKNIVIHSSELNISKVTFARLGENQSNATKHLEYRPWQQIAIQAPEHFQKGQSYILTLEYTAYLSGNYYGFYNSSYENTKGEKWFLAATQFEPLAARKAFPCFDEPAFKASFLIKIRREAEYICLSNMPKSSTTVLPNGIHEDVFENSVNMSTYLVAFIVSNFQNISMNANGTLVSVYTVPEKLDQASYALETAVKLLTFYNKFFQKEYPLKKLDLVAIPDFLAGAMENWGLITFRENTLLLDNNSSILDKQLVTTVIAHELAHQWFGNLVTMYWWNDLWLNEGFATYMEYTSIAKTFPELEIEDEFLITRFKAMAQDSLNSSHAISTNVTAPEQIEEMFDSVSYEKGASILLMLNSILTEEKFQDGVVDYLKQYSYGNTKNQDLWNRISKSAKANFSVTDMMNTWTLQKGFPLVNVTRNGKDVKLTQEHFLLTVDSENATQQSSYQWHIPLTYVNDSCSNSSSCKQVFVMKDKFATLTLPANVAWLKFNFKNEGFYIVDYGVEGWEALIKMLKETHEALTYQDRACLVNNIFALSRLGRVSFRQVLNLIAYLGKEKETAPVTEALSQLNRIYRLLDKRGLWALAGRMKGRILKLFGSLIRSQTWDEEGSVSERMLRSSLLETACHYQEAKCIENAQALFRNWTQSNGTMRIPGDLMKTVFTVGAQSEKGWEFLNSAYHLSMFEAEKHTILESLASTQDVRKIVWLLQASLRGSDIQTQEFPLILSEVCKSYAGHLYAWDFVKENWDKILEKFSLGSFAIQSIVHTATYQFSTKTRLLEVMNFLVSLKDKGSQMRSVQEAIETIKLNIQWMDRNLDILDQEL
uniref:Leucyl/cystinyl aminopeptidase n=1 Tax=Lepisosteus oculatus TaxID=7918 RepID=W5MGX3_LEPOC|nr:PREDICTED: leucyl-cystinyl aminopeptidase [Lepisosteus oculatus]